MTIKNKKKDDGTTVKNFVSNILKNMKEGINNASFELTTDNGKTLHHKSINKIKFSVKRNDKS